jgi:GNAT superfamily N-acetyltransferase
MPWRFSSEPGSYAARVWDLLAADPVAHTVALTVLDGVLAGRRWSDAEMLFGWYVDDGRVTGAVSMTPPFELLLAEVPDVALPELVGALRAAAVPGVVGEAGRVDRFVRLWTADRRAPGRTVAVPVMRQRLHRLDRLRAPAAPPGAPERASCEDIPLVTEWLAALQWEADTIVVDVGPAARTAVGDGLAWLWRDPVGAPTALAARTRVVAGMARIAPVYTPPDRRRRGYGAAVTTACAQDALRAGATEVVLFTDLANPTSNRLYRRLGFVPRCDHNRVRFVDSPGAGGVR